MEEIFKRTDQTSGLNINGTKLNNLRLADDIVLFVDTEMGVEKDLDAISKEGRGRDDNEEDDENNGQRSSKEKTKKNIITLQEKICKELKNRNILI